MSESISDETSEQACFGPSIPPALLKRRLNEKSRQQRRDEQSSTSGRRRQLGPSKPPDSLLDQLQKRRDSEVETPEEFEIEPIIGPLPSVETFETTGQTDDHKTSPEKRKLETTDESEPPTKRRTQTDQTIMMTSSLESQRPEWMVNPNLPSTLQIPYRNVRSFAPKSHIVPELHDSVDIMTSEKDTQLQHQIKLYNEKYRKESLLQLHEKRHVETPSEHVERLPFDRARDLSLSRQMTEQQRREIIRKSSELNTRFSSSKAHGHFL
jgi:hypothetical protein